MSQSSETKIDFSLVLSMFNKQLD